MDKEQAAKNAEWDRHNEDLRKREIADCGGQYDMSKPWNVARMTYEAPRNPSATGSTPLGTRPAPPSPGRPSMYSKTLDSIVGFRDGRWLDDGPAREVLGIVAQHITAEIDRRIAREQMGGGFGVVVDSLESLREWIWNDPLTLEWRAKLDAGERGESR